MIMINLFMLVRSDIFCLRIYLYRTAFKYDLEKFKVLPIN